MEFVPEHGPVARAGGRRQEPALGDSLEPDDGQVLLAIEMCDSQLKAHAWITAYGPNIQPHPKSCSSKHVREAKSCPVRSAKVPGGAVELHP